MLLNCFVFSRLPTSHFPQLECPLLAGILPLHQCLGLPPHKASLLCSRHACAAFPCKPCGCWLYRHRPSYPSLTHTPELPGDSALTYSSLQHPYTLDNGRSSGNTISWKEFLEETSDPCADGAKEKCSDSLGATQIKLPSLLPHCPLPPLSISELLSAPSVCLIGLVLRIRPPELCLAKVE